MRSRLNSLLAMGVALIMALSAPVAAQVTRVTVWTRGAWFTELNKLVARFNAEVPDVQVELVPHGSRAQTIEKYMLAFVTGEIPDIMVETVASPGTFGLGLTGIEDYLEDLTPYLNRSNVVGFLPGTLEALRHPDGRQLGLPMALEDYLMMWNGRLLEESGVDPRVPTIADTWSELRALAQKLTRRGGEGVTRWGLSGYLDGDHVREQLWSFNSTHEYIDVENQRTTVRPGNPAAEWLIDFWYDAFHQSQYASINRDVGHLAENAPIYIESAVYTLGRIRGAGNTDPIYASAVPRHDEGSRIRIMILNQWVMLKDSPNKEAAWRFLEWVSNPENQQKHLLENGGTWIVGLAPGPGAYPPDLLAQVPVIEANIRAVSEYPFAVDYLQAVINFPRPGLVVQRIARNPGTSPSQILNDYAIEVDARLANYFGSK